MILNRSLWCSRSGLHAFFIYFFKPIDQPPNTFLKSRVKKKKYILRIEALSKLFRAVGTACPLAGMALAIDVGAGVDEEEEGVELGHIQFLIKSVHWIGSFGKLFYLFF